MTGAAGDRLPVLEVRDVDDPRLGDYRHLKDRDLSAEGGGRFIAESERVVQRLLQSNLPVHSLLLTRARLTTLEPALLATRPRCPIYLAEQALMNQIAGFPVHRGCLAVGQRPAAVAIPADARTLLVLEDLVDADNLGASVRNAAAFGADALVLSPRCADPFYRKAIRVAIGSTFALPIVRLVSWPDDLVALKQPRSQAGVQAGLQPGFQILGAVVDDRAPPLATVRRPERVALLLGTEGPGLSTAARAACDGLLTIPMAPGADSLNVATAGAVALYHLQQGATTG